MTRKESLHIIFIPADPVRGMQNKVLTEKDLADPFPAVRQLIDGWVQQVNIVDLKGKVIESSVLLVDEEGLLTQKPLNIRASILYGFLQHGRIIVGDAVLIGYSDTYDSYRAAPTISIRKLEHMFAKAQELLPFPELYPMPSRKGR